MGEYIGYNGTDDDFDGEFDEYVDAGYSDFADDVMDDAEFAGFADGGPFGTDEWSR